MKVLVIVASNNFSSDHIENITILRDKMNQLSQDYIVDYAGISSIDDIHNYDPIISFKYTRINPKKQFNKICDFLSTEKNLEYDWYIKIRPEIRLLEQIDFTILCEKSINARARHYYGPKQIKNGMSVGGEGIWHTIKDSHICSTEQRVELDDQIYIFHKNVLEMGGFVQIDPYKDENEHEGFHDHYWRLRNISRNVIGIDVIFYHRIGTQRSGNLNIE